VGARGWDRHRGSYKVSFSVDPEKLEQCREQGEVVSADDGMEPLERAARGE
jgi:hypothetical protein